jgi:hypothetical protein
VASEFGFGIWLLNLASEFGPVGPSLFQEFEESAGDGGPAELAFEKVSRVTREALAEFGRVEQSQDGAREGLRIIRDENGFTVANR